MTSLAAAIRADLAANAANPKGKVAVTAFRLAQHAHGEGPPPWWSRPVAAAYRVMVEWVLGIEIPPAVTAGPGLAIWHGVGLVVHSNSTLGAGVTLRQGVTIGATDDGADAVAPVLGDRVSVGVGALILGPIHVGDDAVIGAGSVVIEDVPAGATVVGNPARVIAGGEAS